MSSGRRPTCAVVRATQPFAGKQGFTYQGAISAESVGATGICMHLLAIPPQGRARPHLHENHETAIYVLQGRAGMWYGDQLEEHIDVSAGDFLYIPAGMPHLPYNACDSEPCIGILARSDPNEQESVVLVPQLEGLR